MGHHDVSDFLDEYEKLITERVKRSAFHTRSCGCSDIPGCGSKTAISFREACVDTYLARVKFLNNFKE